MYKKKFLLTFGLAITLFIGWIIYLINILSPQKNYTNVSYFTTGEKVKEKKINLPKKEEKNVENTAFEKGNLTKSTSTSTTGNENITFSSGNGNLTIVLPKYLVHKINLRFFKLLAKKKAKININFNFYTGDKLQNLQNADLAIVPAYTLNEITSGEKFLFKIPIDFNFSAIFDSSFEGFVSGNSFVAVPFAIDPIVYFSSKKLPTTLDFETLKEIILSQERFDSNGRLITFPVLLGFDKKYLLIEKSRKKGLLPINDIIAKFYFFNKNYQALNLLKDFGQNLLYKTFDLVQLIKYSTQLKKIAQCKKNFKFCLLGEKKATIIFDFLSSKNFFDENKKFFTSKFKLKKLYVGLIITNSNYPAKLYVILINPKSENLSGISKFLEFYIKNGQNGKLGIYKNIISPFVNSQKNYIFNNFFGNFISLKKMGIRYPIHLNQEEIHYLLGY